MVASKPIIIDQNLIWAYMQYVPVGLSPDICWPWRGARDKSGYGVIRYKGRMYLTTRLTYALHNKLSILDTQLLVLHSCDYPPCVNGVHLSLGTHIENARQMFERERANKAIGSNNGNSKLNEDQVKLIREQARLGKQQQKLADEFGLCLATVNEIINRKIWRHISD